MDLLTYMDGDCQLGDATVNYTCHPVMHGKFDNHPASLIVIDFDLDYDDTCAITHAQFLITFGSRRTTNHPKDDSADTPSVEVPYATKLRAPIKATQPLPPGASPTTIQNQTTWRLKVDVVGVVGLETPETSRTTSGSRTDSGWRLVGSPVFVNKPCRSKRAFRWRLTGHEFDRFPVPERFSLGMVVRHDMEKFWMRVDVKGSLRGIVKNSSANLFKWDTPGKGWWVPMPDMLQEKATVIDQKLLEREMGERWEVVPPNVSAC